MQPVAAMLDRHDRQGGFLVRYPEYRPELVRALAESLELAYGDFRASVMAPMGWEAARLPLDALDQWLVGQAEAGGSVVNNAEALLATKTPEERSAWLARFVGAAWSAPVLIPLVLFGADAPQGEDRVAAIDPGAVPEQTLLTRLLSTP